MKPCERVAGGTGTNNKVNAILAESLFLNLLGAEEVIGRGEEI